MTEGQITALLAARHSEDIFVPQCKDGPTHSRSNHFKLDVWAMRRSWANWSTIGYEIKVARQDWIRDTKHNEYAKLVHEFYLVSPPGVIMPDELADGIGLLWCSKTATRLYTKRKAAYRDIEPPVDLLLYVLMFRALIDRFPKYDQRSGWEHYFTQKHDDRLFGANLRGRIAQRFRERVESVNLENERLRARIEKFHALAAEIERRGIPIYGDASSIADRIQEILPSGFRRALESLKSSIEKILRETEQAKGA